MASSNPTLDSNMTLDNLNCPQFVDFTNGEAFNINDGADLLFENHMVGEKEDQVRYPGQKKDAIQMLKEATNQQQQNIIAAAIVLTTATTKKPRTPAKSSTKTPVSSSRRSQQQRRSALKENLAPTKAATRPITYSTTIKSTVKANVFVEAHKSKRSIENDETRIISCAKEQTLEITDDASDATITLPSQPEPAMLSQQQERRRSKSCNVSLMNKTLVVRSDVGDHKMAYSSRRSRRTMLEIKEADEKTQVRLPPPPPSSLSQQHCVASNSKTRTPCFQRLYNQRHKSADRTQHSGESGRSSGAQNQVPNTPMLTMYRGLKFVPKFNGSTRPRMSPAPSIESLASLPQLNTTFASATKSAAKTTATTTASYKSTNTIAIVNHHQKQHLMNNLTDKINNLKIMVSSSAAAEASKKASATTARTKPVETTVTRMSSTRTLTRRSNLPTSASTTNLSSHQPVIVHNNRSSIKPTRIVGAPHFHTEARALKRQESAASLLKQQQQAAKPTIKIDVHKKAQSNLNMIKKRPSLTARSNSHMSLAAATSGVGKIQASSLTTSKIKLATKFTPKF